MLGLAIAPTLFHLKERAAGMLLLSHSFFVLLLAFCSDGSLSGFKYFSYIESTGMTSILGCFYKCSGIRSQGLVCLWCCTGSSNYSAVEEPEYDE